MHIRRHRTLRVVVKISAPSNVLALLIASQVTPGVLAPKTVATNTVLTLHLLLVPENVPALCQKSETKT